MKAELTEGQKKNVDQMLRSGATSRQAAVRLGLTKSLVDEYKKVSPA